MVKCVVTCCCSCVMQDWTQLQCCVGFASAAAAMQSRLATAQLNNTEQEKRVAALHGKKIAFPPTAFRSWLMWPSCAEYYARAHAYHAHTDKVAEAQTAAAQQQQAHARALSELAEQHRAKQRELEQALLVRTIASIRPSSMWCIVLARLLRGYCCACHCVCCAWLLLTGLPMLSLCAGRAAARGGGAAGDGGHSAAAAERPRAEKGVFLLRRNLLGAR